MLYPLVRALSAASLRWFYSRIDSDGLDRIPAHGPAILAVNHPNAMVDAMVVALVCPRRILFTGKATLFANPVLAGLLRSLGVVPLIRTKDVAEVGAPGDASRNVGAFDALTEALRRGRLTMIFPEGITGDHPRLAPLRTGAARIALRARDAGVAGLVVIPVGLTFERKDAPRTRVFVQAGEPIRVDALPRVDAETDARALTQEIERRLVAVTLNFATVDAAERDRALAAVLARLFRGTQAIPEVWQPHVPLADQVAITHRVDSARARLAAASAATRERADRLLARLDGFRADLRAEQVAIEDLEISLDVPSGTRFVARESAVALLAGPVALWGWLNHWIPFNLARALALKSIESAADPAMRTILFGLALVLCFYVLQGALVLALLGGTAALLYVVSLPIAAEVNFTFRARLARALRRARAYLRFRGNRALRARLTAELAWLRAEALAVENEVNGGRTGRV
jgi:glycerol-3-phosphate O-acyltransferase/dihydroxyacetone phosphate acyltransferase